MTIFGLSLWRFVAAVIVAELIPVLLLVLAMVPVGLAIGGRPSQETASAWGAWIGPIGGALSTGIIAWMCARGSTQPIALGAALGLAVAVFDLAWTLAATQGTPFRLLFAISALSRLAAGVAGGFVASRSSISGG